MENSATQSAVETNSSAQCQRTWDDGTSSYRRARTRVQDLRALILCRDKMVSLVIARCLPPAIKGVHGAAAEDAVHRSRLAGCSVAFIDCDMPDWVFRKVNDACNHRSGGLSVIGLRGQKQWRPMKLLAEGMIVSYVRAPMSTKVMRTLIEHAIVRHPSTEERLQAV